jgi:hypothetical protein
MAVDTQPRPRDNRGLLIGAAVVAGLILLAVALIMAWNALGGLAVIAGGVSDAAGRVAAGAEGAQQSFSLGGDQILAPNQFVRVQADYVLQPGDLSVNYYLPAGETGRVSNNELIGAMGQLEGKRYVLATGRVDGWETRLKRSSSNVIAPAGWYSTVDVFETSDGASAALSPEWFWAYTDPDRAPSEWLKDGCDLGHECLMFLTDKFDPATGLTTLTYHVAFRYHNVVVWVAGHGLDVDITPDDVLAAAQSILDRLAQQPLTSE